MLLYTNLNNKMTLAFFAAHPSQYYIFRGIIKELNNNDFILIGFEKDILSELIKNDKIKNPVFLIKKNKKNNFSFISSFFKKVFYLYKIIIKNKVKIIVGTSITLIFAAKIAGIKSVILTEDDITVTKLSAYLGYWFCDYILAPKVCYLGLWGKKSIRYNGYQKLVYLHPNYFSPNITVKNKYLFAEKEKIFLLRFSALNAHHDIGISGISYSLAKEIIEYLINFGIVYISSEKTLPEYFEKYKLVINPLDIHQVLLNCSLLIGDSQSMSVEASILGVPSIRISDLSGKISVLNELEHKYGLTFGFKPNDREQILNKIQEIVYSDRSEFIKRRNLMISEKTDVRKFISDFLIKLYYEQ